LLSANHERSLDFAWVHVLQNLSRQKNLNIEFKDYCHPIEPANQLITREILQRLKMDSGELRAQELQQNAQ